MLLKFENRVTNVNLTPIWVNAVVSNHVNNEVFAMIGFGATSRRVASARRVACGGGHQPQ
jgi:hypothetical protein